MRINPVLAKLGSYPIAELQDRARAMRAAGLPLIDFSIGDPREPTPGFIPQALKEAVPAVSQYPTTAGLRELREAVAGYVRRRFGVTVDPRTQVLPVSGSKEAIFSTPLAFVDRDAGDVVVWATPGYPIYERGALLAGAVGHPVRLEGDFVLRADQIPEPIWSRARLVWTCSPHNPTGSVSGPEVLAGLVDRARAVGALVCSDECYADLYEEEPPASVLQVAGAGLEGVLSYLSLSKRSGMTGYRSGAMVGQAEAIAALKDLRSGTGTASPEFVQLAAAAAWADDDHPAARRAVFAAKRAVIRRAFTELGYEMVASRAGLYAWVQVGDDVAVASRLLESGVVVSPGRAFGPGGEGYVRLALVPTLEECERSVEVLQRCLTAK